MALKYKVKTEKVFDGDHEAGEVHGLSLNAIVGLIQLNRPEVEALFDKFQGRDPQTISDDEVGAVGMDMLEKSPILVAQIIALASDAHDGRERAEDEPTVLDEIMEMPLGLQLAFLMKIGELTFSAGGGAKKVLALAMKAVQGGSQSAG